MKPMFSREIPECIQGYGPARPYQGTDESNASRGGGRKIIRDFRELVAQCGLTDGMTISFHHHLRNGDQVLNRVLQGLADMGFRDLKIAVSSIFPVHVPLIQHIKNGVVTGLYTDYISGPVAQAVSEGFLATPMVMQTHGGRARAIQSGELSIDVAFIASPACDWAGNINGIYGRSACGFLGYAVADAMFSRKVVAITDNLVEYPNHPIEISQEYVDFVWPVESLGDAQGIVSGTTRITKDPIGLKIAELASRVMVASGLLKNGFSFQTGAGGTSLAVASYLREYMRENQIRGSFASGGITGYLVEMLEEDLFGALLDVQCFDPAAVESQRRNKNHMGMSASLYANPQNKGAVVNQLDVVILGATEIDRHFNVNVTTDSNGILMGGSGGHSDTAAGAKLAMVVTQLTKSRLPILVDSVTTLTTPGETIDVVVTERGIAVNPLRPDIWELLRRDGLPVISIEDLQKIAFGMTGKPDKVVNKEKIVAVVEYRDGSVIDIVHQISG